MKIWIMLLLVCMWAVPSLAEPVSISTMEDQASVYLTVYNMDRGLVKDVRKMAIPSGEGELRFMDVASQIMPQTVHVKSITSPDKFRVLEQNYEYDLISRAKLLDKYVGKKIKLFNWNQYQDKKETLEATLLSNNGGEVYDINGEIYLGHPGTGVLPSLPEDLIAKPTLTWMFDNAEPGPQELEVSYMTGGVTWSADYVFVINKDDTAGDLSGWVTVDNKSGATYKDASLKLVAGKVNVQQPMNRMRMAADDIGDQYAASPKQFQEESLFEYHLYDLQRKTTIKDKQTKQISLLEAAGITTSKSFIVSGNEVNYYWQAYNATRKVPVKVAMTFKNSEANHVGMALPAGIVRLYKQDKKGGQQFIGEDRIDHMPKDEDVKLSVGEAFDIVVEKKQTDFRRTSNRSSETAWEVTLRNHKDENIVVSVEERLQGMTNWEVLTSSMEYKKKDAQAFVFEAPVPANGESVVTYTVQVIN